MKNYGETLGTIGTGITFIVVVGIPNNTFIDFTNYIKSFDSKANFPNINHGFIWDWATNKWLWNPWTDFVAWFRVLIITINLVEGVQYVMLPFDSIPVAITPTYVIASVLPYLYQITPVSLIQLLYVSLPSYVPSY